MRSSDNRFVAALGAIGALMVAGCGDDQKPATDVDANTQADVADSEGDSDAADTVQPDTTPPDTRPEEVSEQDPCEPNPCTGKATECAVDGKVVSFSTPGVCTPDDDVARCIYAPVVSACDAGKVCLGGACVNESDPCTYTFDPRVSYTTAITIGNQGSAGDTCCFDFTGDGTPDNALGDLLKTGSAITNEPINGTIAGQIATGQLTLLLETRGVDNATDDSAIEVVGFYGSDADEDGANNAAGTSTFVASRESFHFGTNVPAVHFPQGSITGGNLRAGPSVFLLSVPLFNAQLELEVSLTEIEGKVAVGPNGNGLTMGLDSALGVKVGGAVKRSALEGALNNFIANCGCVEFTDPADTQLIGDDGECNAATTDRCGVDVSDACKGFPERCSLLLNFIESDVDTACFATGRYVAADCSGVPDALSVGIWLKATSGTISGVAECTP